MFVILWEFRVPEDRFDAFERIYGSDGDWAKLFARSDGYLGTTLLRDAATPGRYVTIDRWSSQSDAEAFRTAFARDYDALDARCQPLTDDEEKVGEFEIA